MISQQNIGTSNNCFILEFYTRQLPCDEIIIIHIKKQLITLQTLNKLNFLNHNIWLNRIRIMLLITPGNSRDLIFFWKWVLVLIYVIAMWSFWNILSLIISISSTSFKQIEAHSLIKFNTIVTVTGVASMKRLVGNSMLSRNEMVTRTIHRSNYIY